MIFVLSFILFNHMIIVIPKYVGNNIYLMIDFKQAIISAGCLRHSNIVVFPFCCYSADAMMMMNTAEDLRRVLSFMANQVKLPLS